MKELNDIIDNQLAGLPSFQCKELHIGNKRLEFYYRDTLQCIRTLYGDPAFLHDLAFSPVQHYTSAEQNCRIVNEMHTSDWWWLIQVRNVNYNWYGDLDKLAGVPGVKAGGCNCHPNNPIVRQDSTNALSEQVSIPHIHDNWKYRETHPLQAVSACANLNRLHSMHPFSGYYKQGCTTPHSGKPFPYVYGKGLSSDRSTW